MKLRNNLSEITSPVLHNYGLNSLETLVLYSVSERNALTIGDVYRSMNLNQGNLSSMCKRLEERGYLIRSRSEKDQRAVILKITDEGEEILNNINHEFNDLFKGIEEISKENIKEAVEGLKCFANIIEVIYSKIEEQE